MKTRFHRSSLAGLAPVLALSFSVLAVPATASAGFVNFDNVVAAPGGTFFPGTQFSANGVHFYSVSIPNAVFVGQTITLTNVVPRMLVIGNNHAISNPNFAAAAGVFSGSPNDLLMVLQSPADFMKVVTDDTPESADIVRLLALQPAPNGQFVITAIRTGLDHQVMAPLNVLSLDLQGKETKFFLFQVTTEAEGIDNVYWEDKPDCQRSAGEVIDPRCFEVPPFKEWIPVGCEIVDCCPGCPGAELMIDWVINYAGDPFEAVALRFEGLDREVAARLRVEGDATWDAERQVLEVRGKGQVVLRGFTGHGADLRWSAASPRMTLDRIDAPAGTGASRALRVKVQQQVDGVPISDSTLVFSY